MNILVSITGLLALWFFAAVSVRIVTRYLQKRGFTVSAWLNFLLMLGVSAALYVCGGLSLWTVKGVVMALILLYASWQDIATHEADDSLWVMLVILSLVGFTPKQLPTMLLGVVAVFLPQILVAVFGRKGGIGGADIKITTAAALSLGFVGGAIGLTIGLLIAVICRSIRGKVKREAISEPFALLPYLSIGLMAGYFL